MSEGDFLKSSWTTARRRRPSDPWEVGCIQHRTRFLAQAVRETPVRRRSRCGKPDRPRDGALEVARQPMDRRVAPSPACLLFAEGLPDVLVQGHWLAVDGARGAPGILPEPPKRRSNG